LPPNTFEQRIRPSVIERGCLGSNRKASEARIQEAEEKALAAQEQNRLLHEAHDTQLEQRLQEQREALEGAQMAAVNAEKSAAYEKELKLTEKIGDLQRWIDNKTAEELGEGAELDLYEVLKEEFEDDRIERRWRRLAPAWSIRPRAAHS
jgi:hypothetical protein